MLSSQWRVSAARGRIQVILHVTRLNLLLNILIRAETFALVVFAVGHLLQPAIVIINPNLPYIPRCSLRVRTPIY